MTLAEVPLWVALPASLLLIVGGLVTLTGAIGLLRLRSFFARMHPPTMGVALGAACVLVASMLISSAVLDRLVSHEILIMLFLLITSPVTAMLLMRAGFYRNGARRDP